MIFLNLIFRRIRKSKKTPVFKTLWNFMYPKWPNYFRKITINSIWESLDFLLVEIWVRLLKMTCDCVNHVMINYRGNVWLSILPPTSLPTTAGRFCLGSSFFFLNGNECIQSFPFHGQLLMLHSSVEYFTVKIICRWLSFRKGKAEIN